MKKFFDVNELKRQLPAPVVVAKYLGEPKDIKGKAFYWDTPFRDGVVSSVPLKVTEDYIIDLGGDFKGDIISFICALKDVSYYKAIQIIANDFNVQGLESAVKENDLKVNIEVEKMKKVVLEQGEKSEEIFTMLDTKAFTKKPTKDEAGEIKNKISSLKIAPYNLETLCQKITKGHTCIPAGIAKEGQKNWKQQQLFMVDIDNVVKVKGKLHKVLSNELNHVNAKKVMEYCQEIGLPPTFMYKTFSYTDECNKLRLVYVMERPITDMETALKVENYLLEQLKPLNIDEAPTNLETMFFGGKELCECTNIYYKPVEKEIEIEKVIYQTDIDYGEEYKPYIEKLQKNGYEVKNGYLCSVDTNVKKDGSIKKDYTPLANFLSIVTKQENYYNGKDTITNYTVKGLLLDKKKELPEISVTGEELEGVKYLTNQEWNIQAIKQPVYRVEDNIRYVSQIVSADSIECKTIYANTGFIRVDGKLVYLSQGQVIGDVKDLDVDLSMDGLERYSFTKKDFDVKDALKTSYSILDVADHKITIPLIAGTYLAPLITIFAENGMLVDFVIWLQGATGSRKSSLAAVSLSHFGDFKRNNFCCSFRDTANSLEKKAYVLKDVLNVIDDFNPETVGTGKIGTSEKVLGMYGDRETAGRGRMNRDGKTLNSAYYPRGLCIVTGESFPEVAESRIARAVIVDVKPTSIDLHRLKVIQDNTEKLSFSMKKYIQRIISNENDVIKKAINTQNELREKEIVGQLHGRTLEAVIMLTIGFELFLEFMCENNVITLKEKENLLTECSTVLADLAKQQKEEIRVNQPTELFVTGIKQLCETGKAQIMNYDIPADPKLFPNLVGYYCESEGQYFLLPETAYAEVQKFCRSQGIKFPISKVSLQKMLYDEGFLYVGEKNDRKTVKRKLPNTGVLEPVWAIYQDKLGLRPFEEEYGEAKAETEKFMEDYKKEITK